MSDLSVSHPCHRVPARRGECGRRRSRTDRRGAGRRVRGAPERQRRLVDRQREPRAGRRLRRLADAGAAAPVQPGHRPRAATSRRRRHSASPPAASASRSPRAAPSPSSARLAEATDHGVTLTFTFEHRAQRLLITRVFACYPGSPTIETWTRIASTGGDGTALTELVAWSLTMPLGNVRWLGGLRGDSANSDGAVGGGVRLRRARLRAGRAARPRIGRPLLRAVRPASSSSTTAAMSSSAG